MSENKTTNSMIMKVEGCDLIFERIFNAPRELVFKTYSESEHLENWWGPKGWQTKNKQFEFKPNGVWHYCMKCYDQSQGDFYGQESWGKAIYHEIIVPEKIVYTDMFADAEGKSLDGMPEILITMTFHEQDGKTKLIIRSRFDSPETLQQLKETGMVEGFSSQMERLESLLEQLQ